MKTYPHILTMERTQAELYRAEAWWNADYDDDEFLTMATYIFEHYKKVEK